MVSRADATYKWLWLELRSGSLLVVLRRVLLVMRPDLCAECGMPVCGTSVMSAEP